MTDEEAQIVIGNIPIKPEILDDCYDITEYQEAKAMAIQALAQKSITWIVGKDNCQVAVRNMPIDKMQKICAIIEEKEQQLCEDCISRTALLSRIDAERKHLLDLKMDGAEHIIVHHARRIIEDMPSVTPQPNIGHWIDTGSGQECSECGEIQYGYDNFRYFCANCGAKMEVEV